MLAIFVIAGLAAGVALGQAFRAFVLLPTTLVLAVLVVVVSLRQGYDPPRVLLETAATVTVLQVGYLLGMFLHDVSARSRSRVRAFGRHGAHGHARPGWVAGRR
jgi:hypothetical protein